MRRTMSIDLADRIKGLPPYLFAEIDRMKKEALKNGVDLIDLSIGDPDIPTPDYIVDALKIAVEKPENHRYPSYVGMRSFREAVSDWCRRRFSVDLDPESEVLSLIGSKEGVGHLPLAFLNTNDVVLCPSPGYPVYSTGTLFAGGIPFFMPLLEENHFLPDFTSIPKSVLEKAKIMFLNYPNNPTSAVAGLDFFREAVEVAHAYNIILCHDAAYSEIYFDGNKPMSLFEVEGAGDVGIELHSLSKTYNMTGWRVGFAVGNSDIISGLGKIKTNLDSGVFQAIQEAAIAALQTGEDRLSSMREIYQTRRDVLYDGLTGAGIDVIRPDATFYLWAKVPGDHTSESFVVHLLHNAGVLCTPGNGFGDPGEGYIRFALTVDEERTKEAAERIRKIL